MAVTLDVAALRNALRLGDTAEETAEVTRLLAYATEAVTRYAPDAPDTIHDEAAIRVAGYLADQPNAGRRDAFANALRSSGAAAILVPYRAHGLGVAGATGTAASSTPATPAAPAGLRQTGIETVIVATADRWVGTALPYPATAIFGVQVDAQAIALGLTANLPDAGVSAGADATAALGTNLFSLGSDRAIMADTGGAIYFAASAAGTYTVRLFEHA